MEKIDLLAVDIGNSNIVIGGFDSGGELTRHWRIATRVRATADEYSVLLKSLFGEERFKGAIVSCVVPSLQSLFLDVVGRFSLELPVSVGPGVRTGISILTDDPREVGADRIVNAVAAFKRYNSAVIVVDFGTAVTFDYVSAKGEYMGGAIAPGLNVSAEALTQKAAKLPKVELSKPDVVVGKSTGESMRSGVYYGYVGLVDGIIGKIKEEAGGNPRVIATGGEAELIAKGCSAIDEVDEFLTLKGLQIIYEANNK